MMIFLKQLIKVCVLVCINLMQVYWLLVLKCKLEKIYLANLFSVSMFSYRHEGRTWRTEHRGRLWIAAAAMQPDDEDILACEQMYRKIYEG